MVKWMTKLLVALWWLPLVALAQGQAPATAGSGVRAWNEIKGEKREVLKLQGDVARGEEAFKICQGCHKQGATGSSSGTYPRLAGQHATVLIEQMTDIRSGIRRNPKMAPFADEHVLTTQEIADIARFLQALPIQANLGRGPGNSLDRGKALYEKDCVICHGNKGQGDAEKFFPLVAGQHFKYLLRQAVSIRDGQRGNANPDMAKVLKPYSDGDLEAVADYMSGLAAP